MVLEGVRALQDGKPIPEELWPYLVCLPPYTTRGSTAWFVAQRRQDTFAHINFRAWIVDLIHQYLVPSSVPSGSGWGGPRLWLTWDDENIRPAWLFHSGLGFLSTVWLEIAQAVCKTGGILQCAHCGDFYVRGMERARRRTDQANYCEACGKGNKGSKSQYRQRQSVLRNQARVLYAAGTCPAEIARQLRAIMEQILDWIRPPGKPGRPRKTGRATVPQPQHATTPDDVSAPCA